MKDLFIAEKSTHATNQGSTIPRYYHSDCDPLLPACLPFSAKALQIAQIPETILQNAWQAQGASEAMHVHDIICKPSLSDPLLQ